MECRYSGFPFCALIPLVVSMRQAKQNTLILLVLAGVLIALFAMSLPELVLLDGQPFTLEEASRPNAPTSVMLGNEALWAFIRGAMAVVLILIPIVLVYSLFSKQGRKRLLRLFILLVVMFLVADYLRSLPPNYQIQEPEEAQYGQDENLGALADPDTVVEVPYDPPQELTTAITLIISALAAGGILAVAWYFRQRMIQPTFSMQKLADEVESAIESLQAGGDLKLTIIQCYQEMSRVLRQEKGISRDTGMTPREFETQLIGKGLPQEAVKTLTRLFEQARYSAMPTGAREEQLAFAALSDIVAVCRAMSEGDRREN